MYGKKAKGHGSFLAIGEQESKIQNAQVNFIKVRRQKKVICKIASSSKAHA